MFKRFCNAFQELFIRDNSNNIREPDNLMPISYYENANIIENRIKNRIKNRNRIKKKVILKYINIIVLYLHSMNVLFVLNILLIKKM